MPVAPVLTAAGNAVALTGTAAYEAGGLPGLAVAGVVMAGGTAAAVVRRRSTVKRRMASRSAGTRGGSSTRRTGAGSFGTGGGSRGGSRGGIGSGTRGAGRGGRPGGVTAGWTPSKTGGGAPGSRRTGSGLGGRRNGTPIGSAFGTLSTSRGKTPSNGGAARHTLGAARHRAGRGNSLPRRAATAVGRGIGRGARAVGRGVGLGARVAGRPAVAIGRGISRGTAALWRATRPHRGRARTATRKGMRYAAAAAWDGVKTIAAATFGRRHGRTALTRLRDAWTRYRTTRAAKNAAKAAAVAAANTPPKTVAATVRRPAGTTAPATFTGGANAMLGGHHFTGPAMEMARAAAAYDPKGMLQVGQDFAGLKDALEMVAEAMKITVDNADAHQPLAAQIVDHMKEIWQLQIRAAELAGELPAAFRSLHQVDLERLENPRKGPEAEAMWDVRSNRI
jgi:hypothetical protein